MSLIALATLLILVQYFVFVLLVGLARGKTVQAPAVSGDETYERRLRVQLNTLEQMAYVLPAIWICAYYFSVNVGLGCAAAFFVGRIIYAVAYYKEPKSRGLGFGIGWFGGVVAIVCALIGVIQSL
jgi:hypothetical protein